MYSIRINLSRFVKDYKRSIFTVFNLNNNIIISFFNYYQLYYFLNLNKVSILINLITEDNITPIYYSYIIHWSNIIFNTIFFIIII